MITKREIIRELEKNRIKLKEMGVVSIELFGSYAKGTHTTKSDIDFLVEFGKGKGTFRNHVELLNFLKKIFKKEIDIIKPHLIREELKESILGGERIAAKL